MRCLLTLTIENVSLQVDFRKSCRLQRRGKGDSLLYAALPALRPLRMSVRRPAQEGSIIQPEQNGVTDNNTNIYNMWLGTLLARAASNLNAGTGAALTLRVFKRAPTPPAYTGVSVEFKMYCSLTVRFAASSIAQAYDHGSS